MTNLKTTKRALLSSVVALLVCFAMLLGTTFAWFTDSVTSAGNIIQTGTLDVSLEHADTILGVDEAGWTDASEGAIFNYSNWEPGYTAVKYVKIENEGSLDLKFILNIIPNNEAEEVNLADVIEVYMVDGAVAVDRAALTTDSAAYVGTLTSLMNENDGAAHGVLYAKANADAANGKNYNEIYTIALKMSTSAGNEYMGKSVGGGFAVQLLATQLASEFDVFDDQYDKDADYTASVGTADELKAALAAGGNVVLTNDITIDEAFAVPAGVTVNLDLNGNTITANNGYAFSLIGCDMTVKNGTVDAKDLYAFMVGSSLNSIPANLTIESGTFKGVTSAVNLCYGTVTINGGYFEATPYNGSYEFTLNCIDRTYNAGNANIIVKGGTFYKFNPADNAAEGVGTNFVADGYTATENGDGTWTVSAPTEVEVKTAAELADALAAGGNIVLADDITLSEKTTSSSICAVVDKEVAIDLNGHDITSPDVVFYVLEGGKLTINGDGNLISGNGGSGATVNVYAYGGEVIINGGTYSLNRSYPNDHGADMIYAHNGGTITINGGTFKYAENVWTLNLKDNTGSAIVVKGGTFEGFNPANNVSEGLNTNFVADGYVATENNGTWTVTAE